MRVRESVILGCGVDEAWEVLTDWERQPKWMGDADFVEVLDARSGVGVRLRVRTRLYDVPAFTEVLEVTAWEPPVRMEIAHRSLVKGRGEWVLTPAEGGVMFTWTEDVTLPLVGDLVAGIYRPFLRKVMSRSLAKLAVQIAP